MSTPRKDLITALKAALKTIATLEYIDLQRGQYEDPKKAVAGSYYTAALIEIADIDYQDMTNQKKLGKTEFTITVYTKEGFAHQFAGSPDPDEGLAQIDLQDDVTGAIEGLHGEQFRACHLKGEGALPSPIPGIAAYKLVFRTTIFKTLKSAYVLN